MLELRQLDAAIGNVTILRNVGFMLAEGDTVALIGRNGAGKTTLLRSIMGFTDVTGSIRFAGQEMTSLAPAHRPGLGIGYAPEDRRLFSAFTVEENLKLPVQVAGLGAAEQAQRLERVYHILPELREMAARPAGNVSGGQGKMVALGRALMLGTRLIMLDEPFQGLAPALARRYAEALRTLRDTDQNVALFITESNPALLRSLADHTLVIERGEVTENLLEPEGQGSDRADSTR